MTALLTDNLPLLAGAPNGIKKLRELILELAVRGKLVPQDPNDEPASELLKRITEEKAQLEVAEQIRKQKPLPQIAQEEQPFELPEGWAWARLADVAFSQAGFAFKSNGFNQAGLGLPLIRIRDVGQPFSGTYYEGDYRPEFLVQRGDYLISMDGEFRVAAWEGEASLLNQRVSRLIFFGEEIARRFIAESLQARLLELQGIKAYTTVDHLSGRQISESVIALPPVAEQHRIVAKVDELMALCDRLEAQQTDAESAHAQLMQALLDSLTQASDAEDFAQNWQRLAEHFHTLFTTESSIDALKQTLLQLAVMGKLVQQDASDESADKLLKRISDQRSTSREKKQKSLADISEVEKPFDLPCQWAWTTLPAIGELARGKSRHRPRNDPSLYAGGNVPLIQTGDVARANGVVKTYSAMYNAKGVEQSRLWPAGTMCITIAANIADSATLGFDACFPDSVVGFIPELPELDVRYFEFFLRTAKSHLEDFAPSTAQKNINLEILGLLSVPLPPANEVRRIVAKVDQLMALCDQLRTRLTQARQLNEQLASTLVEQAVA